MEPIGIWEIRSDGVGFCESGTHPTLSVGNAFAELSGRTNLQENVVDRRCGVANHRGGDSSL